MNSKSTSADLINRYFVKSLLNRLNQGVGFVDPKGTVLIWNPGAEKITGVPASTMIGNAWSGQRVPFFSNDGDLENRCPVDACLEFGKEIESRITFERQEDEYVSAKINVSPLKTEHGQLLGALLIIEDQSSEKRLQKQVVQLNRQMSLDPLTKVPNRVEFDRAIDDCLVSYEQETLISSLIICDIDFFKRINDDYGHEKGDRALVAFAAHLQKYVRGEDLVARYGGEEFVIVCRDCDLELAAERAEVIRRDLEQLPQNELNGKCLTASFGVATIERGDDEKSWFVRADHALLNAKETGRNRVIQSKLNDYRAPDPKRDTEAENQTSWREIKGEPLVQEQYETPTPPDVLLTKIRGFIEEQNAKIKNIDQNFMTLDFGGNMSLFRRGGDHALGLIVDIEMKQEELESDENPRRGNQTIMRCTVRPRRKRDRRVKEIREAATHLLQTLRGYLMISPPPSLPERAATRPGDGRT